MGAVGGASCAAIVVTYARLDPDGALPRLPRRARRRPLARAGRRELPALARRDRALLVALDALPRRAWSLAGPAIALCAVTAWPGSSTRTTSTRGSSTPLPALGVALALGLTVAATRASGGAVRRRACGSTRSASRSALIVLLVSIPWLAAELGVLPARGRRSSWSGPGSRPTAPSSPPSTSGTTTASTAPLLVPRRSCSRGRTCGRAVSRWRRRLYVSLMFAYGAVNLAQDAWNEQLVKRGLVDWRIPSALEPAPEPVWLVVLALAAVAALVLRRASGRRRLARVDEREVLHAGGRARGGLVRVVSGAADPAAREHRRAARDARRALARVGLTRPRGDRAARARRRAGPHRDGLGPVLRLRDRGHASRRARRGLARLRVGSERRAAAPDADGGGRRGDRRHVGQGAPRAPVDGLVRLRHRLPDGAHDRARGRARRRARPRRLERRRAGAPGRRRRSAIVAGEKRHITVDRALRLLGIGDGQARLVRSDEQGRMRRRRAFPTSSPRATARRSSSPRRAR